MTLNWFLWITLVLLGAGGFVFYYYRPKTQARTESIYTHALNAMVRGDRRIALNHLRDVVKQDTNHIDAYLQMGDILREEGNAQAAVKIHQSLTVRPNLSNDINRDIHKSLALDFEQLGQFAKARREAEFVLKQNKKILIKIQKFIFMMQLDFLIKCLLVLMLGKKLNQICCGI